MRHRRWLHTLSTCLRPLRSLTFVIELVSRVFSVHVLSNASGLAKLLPLLPNLDTLEVLNGEDTGSSIEHSFKPIRLPQIRMLVIDAGIHYLMKSCTNVKRIVIEHKRFNDSYLESIPFIAGSLVSLALCFPEPQNIRGVDVLCPSCQVCDSSERLDLVRLCPNLEELGLIQVSPISATSATPRTLKFNTDLQFPSLRLYNCRSGLHETPPPRGRPFPRG